MTTDHPEMADQIGKVGETLSGPDIIVISKTDPDVRLYYRHYKTTPVTEKELCVVVKIVGDNLFIITAYFTDTIKRGEIIWGNK